MIADDMLMQSNFKTKIRKNVLCVKYIVCYNILHKYI